MVAIRSFFILSVAAGIVSAGKCKPESRSSSVVSVPSSTVSASDTASLTASASATLIESTTTLADSTVETSTAESASETASSATSAVTTETGTTEFSLTTLLTSFITSKADTTTTEAATTTTTLASTDPTCPSTVDQCAGDSAVLYDVQLSDLQLAGFSIDILECASFRDQDEDRAGLPRVRSNGACFKVTPLTADFTRSDLAGWDSGIKGTCGQSFQRKTTVFTSTAETTTAEAATSTAPATPGNNFPSQCINSALIQCDVALGDLTLAGISNDITECSQFCEQDDDCRGFSRRRDTGACFKAVVDPDDVTQSEREGWESGIMNTCFN